ncbi:hypothetical protein NLJ89_g6136 [Agrocybe chaxingu]|uniref:Uncharacterized protein n=1 Tax=Agrocybe chaxingu TaxID=84603 RepID=A0A9W8JZP9_9AGAR|nr:hypothetical protein NLJ89_g6136 [Agrocybe chaxingu]
MSTAFSAPETRSYSTDPPDIQQPESGVKNRERDMTIPPDEQQTESTASDSQQPEHNATAPLDEQETEAAASDIQQPESGAPDPQYSESQVNLPGRPREAPVMYEALNHPLRPPHGGRVFVFYMDTTLEGMKRTFDYEKSLSIPYGDTKEELEKQGYLRLRAGDYVFAACTRINKQERRPSLDELKIWVTGIECIPNQDSLDSAQKKALGPREKRTGRTATYDKEKDEWYGATEVERSCRAEEDSRAQTLGPSRQKEKKIVGPARASKVATANAPWDDNLKIRSELIAASGAAAAVSLGRATAEVVDALKTRTDIVNHFKCGPKEVFGYSTIQLNLAGAQFRENAVPMKTIGKAGSKHFDELDHPECFTNTLSCPDIPDDFEPGNFFILLPRVYASLDKYAGLNFSGLHLHGGTSLMPLAGQDIEGWETRLVLVHYAQRIAMDGSARKPIAAMPDNIGVYTSTQELLFPEQHTEKRGRVNIATFGREGASVTEQQSHVEFMAREPLLMSNFNMLQLPERYRVQIDADRFLSAFSSVIGDKRTTVPLWVHAPGHQPKGASKEMNQAGTVIEDLEDQTEFRREVLAKLESHRLRTAQFIPHCIINGKTPALTNEDIEAIIKVAKAERGDKAMYTKLSYTNRIKQDRYHDRRYRVLDPSMIAKDSDLNDGDTGDFEDGFRETSKFDKLVNKDDNMEAERTKEALAIKRKLARQEAKGRAAAKSTKGDKGPGKGKNAQPKAALKSPNENKDGQGKQSTLTKGKNPASTGHSDGHKYTKSGGSVTPTNDKPAGERSGAKRKASSYDDKGPSPKRGRVESTSNASRDNIGPSGIIKNRAYVLLPVQNRFKPSKELRNIQAMARKAEPKSSKDFPVLNSFTLETVVEELRQVECEVLAAHKWSTDERAPELQQKDRVNFEENDKCIRRLQDSDDPSSLSVAQSLMSIRQDITFIDFNHAGSELVNRLTRWKLMQANLAISRWLDVKLAKEVRRLLRCPAGVQIQTEEDWICSLVRNVRNMVELQMPSRNFQAVDYGIREVASAIAAVDRTLRYTSTEAEMAEEIVRITQSVTAEWFGLPKREDRWKSWVLGLLADIFGDEVLVLDATWRIYRYASKGSILKQHRSIDRPGLPENLDPLRVAINEHQLCASQAQATAVLRRIVLLLEGFLVGRLDADTIKRAEVYDHRLCKYNVYTQIASGVKERRSMVFAEFMCQSLALFYNDLPIEKATRLQVSQFNDPERYSPFQEHTPARSRMRDPDGPYCPEVITTNGGLFSAIVWRAITYHTDFALFERATFNDLDDWNEATAAITDSKYICNTSAYGQPDPHRSPAHAPTYWQSVLDLDWERYCCKSSNTFWDTYKLLHPANKRPLPFPHLGPLGGYNLTADLTYSGVHELPDSNIIAKCVAKINLGSMHGIQLLDGQMALPRTTVPKATVTECKQGLQQAFKIMDQVMTASQKEFIGLDYILVESAMCKFYRAFGEGMLSEDEMKWIGDTQGKAVI